MSDGELGTCDLCGQEMIRTDDDCWHPHDAERACPPEPGPMMASPENWDAWQEFHAAGLRPGRPGREHFTPTPHRKDDPMSRSESDHGDHGTSDGEARVSA